MPIACTVYLSQFIFGIYKSYAGLPPETLTIIGGIAGAITYISCGSMIAKYSWPPKLVLYLIVLGVSLMALQSYFMYLNHIDISSINLIGRLPTSLGVFMLALLHPEWGKGTFFQKLGLVTLWIYGIHPFILDQLYPLKQYTDPVIWNIVFPLAVYVISLSIVLGLKTVVKRRQAAMNPIKERSLYPTGHAH